MERAALLRVLIQTQKTGGERKRVGGTINSLLSINQSLKFGGISVVAEGEQNGEGVLREASKGG